MGVDLDEDDFRPFFEALDTEIMAHVLGTGRGAWGTMPSLNVGDFLVACSNCPRLRPRGRELEV